MDIRAALDPNYRFAISYEENGSLYYGNSQWDDRTQHYIKQLNEWTAEDRAEEDGAREEYYRLIHECEGEALDLESIRASVEELKRQFRD